MSSKLSLITLLLALSAAAFSQNKNPFQSIGKQGKIITLSKGKYDELFDQNEIQQIGTALVDIRTMKVVKLLNDRQEAQHRSDNSTNSRFLSIDPITNKFPMLSPYQYASNSPIAGIDMDGLEFYFAADGSYLGQSKNGGTQIRVATQYSTYTLGTGNNATTGFVFTQYKDIDKVNPKIAGKVYETIFRREVGDDVKSITVINETDQPTKSAETYSKGNFGINTANEENGEKLNNDYFNAAATLYHENQHSEKLPIRTSDGFSHFGIQEKVVEQSGLYVKTSPNFKSYVQQLFDKYLGQEEASLVTLIEQAHSDKSQIYSTNYYLKQYKKDLQYFNSKFHQSRQEYDYESYEKKWFSKDKSVINK